MRYGIRFERAAGNWEIWQIAILYRNVFFSGASSEICTPGDHITDFGMYQEVNDNCGNKICTVATVQMDVDASSTDTGCMNDEID